MCTAFAWSAPAVPQCVFPCGGGMVLSLVAPALTDLVTAVQSPWHAFAKWATLPLHAPMPSASSVCGCTAQTRRATIACAPASPPLFTSLAAVHRWPSPVVRRVPPVPLPCCSCTVTSCAVVLWLYVVTVAYGPRQRLVLCCCYFALCCQCCRLCHCVGDTLAVACDASTHASYTAWLPWRSRFLCTGGARPRAHPQPARGALPCTGQPAARVVHASDRDLGFGRMRSGVALQLKLERYAMPVCHGLRAALGLVHDC